MAQQDDRFDLDDTFNNAANTPSVGSEAVGDGVDFDQSLPDTDRSSITADERDELGKNTDGDEVV